MVVNNVVNGQAHPVVVEIEAARQFGVAMVENSVSPRGADLAREHERRCARESPLDLIVAAHRDLSIVIKRFVPTASAGSSKVGATAPALQPG